MDIFAVVIQIVLQFHLGGVVGVRAENHAAVLPVKREVGHLPEGKSQVTTINFQKERGLFTNIYGFLDKGRHGPRDILVVEGFVLLLSLYLYRAGAAVDGWWKPVDCPIAVNQDVDVESHIKLTVITAEIERQMLCSFP